MSDYHPGILFKNFIKELTLTELKVSKEMGIHPITLIRLLKGKTQISEPMASKISNFMSNHGFSGKEYGKADFWIEMSDDFYRNQGKLSSD